MLYHSLDWIEALAVDPKGETFYTGSLDHSIKIWNVKDLSIIYTIAEAHQGDSIGRVFVWWLLDYVYSLAISRDGSLLASGSRDKSVKLWNLRKLSQENVFANAHKGMYGESTNFSAYLSLWKMRSNHLRSLMIWNCWLRLRLIKASKFGILNSGHSSTLLKTLIVVIVKLFLVVFLM